VAFKVKCKIFRTIDTKECEKYLKSDTSIEDLTACLHEDGYEASVDEATKIITSKPASSMDAEI
jgi:hypothetical protein